MANNQILIADDEPIIVQQLKEAFTTNGYRAVCTSNGLEAWDALIALHPDDVAACVIDLQMPPGSFGGKDLVAKIRRGFSTRLPVAVYSGRGTISSSHEVTKVGADAFVEKEVGTQKLVDIVTKLIAEGTRPLASTPSSLNDLARNSDLPALALRSLRNLETMIRAEILTKFAPANLLTAFSQKRQNLPPHVVDKLRAVRDFAQDKLLGLGDLLDILAALSASQLQRLPPASELRRSAGQIVPVRNSLFHGRAISDRELLITILSTDDLIDKIRKFG
jgi:DNA-binding response OmpR family regulator